MENSIDIPVSIAEIMQKKELIMSCSHKWQKMAEYMALCHPT